MQTLVVEGTHKTPTVNFNPITGSLEIRGRSIPDNAVEFYEPILSWIGEYAVSPKPETTLLIELDYFNTSSSKKILDVLKAVELLHLSGKSKAIIKWLYEEGDDDLKEAALEFGEIIQVKFELISVKAD